MSSTVTTTDQNKKLLQIKSFQEGVAQTADMSPFANIVFQESARVECPEISSAHAEILPAGTTAYTSAQHVQTDETLVIGDNIVAAVELSDATVQVSNDGFLPKAIMQSMLQSMKISASNAILKAGFDSFVHGNDSMGLDASLAQSPSGVATIQTAIQSVLSDNAFDFGTEDVFVAVSPRTKQAIADHYRTLGTPLADEVYNGKNGTVSPRRVTNYGSGMKLVDNARTPHQVVFNLATNPTAGETIKIGNIQWTYVSSISAGIPKTILIGNTPTATALNTQNAFTFGAGDGTTYTSPSKTVLMYQHGVKISEYSALKRLQASVTNASNVLTVTVYSRLGTDNTSASASGVLTKIYSYVVFGSTTAINGYGVTGYMINEKGIIVPRNDSFDAYKIEVKSDKNDFSKEVSMRQIFQTKVWSQRTVHGGKIRLQVYTS